MRHTPGHGTVRTRVKLELKQINNIINRQLVCRKNVCADKPPLKDTNDIIIAIVVVTVDARGSRVCALVRRLVLARLGTVKPCKAQCVVKARKVS
jgi:hypothetical protein